MISLQNYSLSLNSKKILDTISFSFQENKILGINGPSQAGKTILTYVLAGIREKHFSHAKISGIIERKNFSFEEIGFVFQNIGMQFSGITSSVEEEIAFALEQFGISQEIIRARIEEQLQQFGISHLRSQNPKTLSGGETKLLVLACELAKHPKLLIIDELSSSLNAKNIFNICQILKSYKNNSTIMVIDSRLDILTSLCDSLLLLHDGKQLYYGKPSQLPISEIPLSDFDVPDWVTLQMLLEKKSLSLSYKETLQWLKNINL